MTEPAALSSTGLRLVVMAVGLRTTRLLLHTFGFHRTITWLGAVPPTRPSEDEPDPRWAAEVTYVAGRPYGGSCLDRSVFLWFVMRQHHLDGDLRIGIAASEAGIDGHAWVEHRDAVLNDDSDIADRFAVFDGDPVGIVFG